MKRGSRPVNSILQLKKANCKNCYKCIRECPVKSIKFADHQANIIKDECILCGACFVACPQNAKQVRNDVPTAKGLIRAAQLAGGKPVVLSLAPSFIADFAVSGLEDLQGIFKAMGFAWAEETAVGAQIVTREYQRMVDQKEQDIIITTCCHTVNTLIQRYYPQAIPYMAHTLSPMLAHAKYIKEQHPGAMVVFAGPCLSKKAEAEQYGYVDCVLTFDELREWMEETQAAVPGLELPPPLTPEEQGRRSRSYPISGGILKTMKPEVKRVDC